MTDGTTNDWSPTWSPNARAVYFLSNRGGSTDLWQRRIGDSGEPEGDAERVTNGLGIGQSVSFSTDGTKFAYSRGRRVANVFRVPLLENRFATWADAEQLTFDQAFIQFVHLSPDGRSLLVSSDRSGNQDIWRLPAKGGEMRQLTTDPTPDWAPSWSPDGRDIAFYAYRSGNRDIWVMPAGGGPGRQLTDHEGQDFIPAWSPDGREIAFSSTRSGNSDIWVVPVEGGALRQLTNHPASDSGPSWSPDGRWIAFQSDRTGETCLWLVSPQGGEAEEIAKGFWGNWSPDGSRLHNRREPNYWSISMKDRRSRQITDFHGRRGELGSPAATDGRYLYFLWQEDLGDLWVMDVEKQ